MNAHSSPLDLSGRVSNTDPTTANMGSGFDSLYLSAKGKIKNKYKDLIELAKLDAKDNRLLNALIELGGMHWAVQPYGRARFLYVIRNDDYEIQLSNPGSVLPMAYVKVSAKALREKGVNEVMTRLEAILHEIAQELGEISLSRLDTFSDFTTDFDFNKLSPAQVVCQARNQATYYQGAIFTGLSKGAGTDTMHRLYDKTREQKRQSSEYLYPYWEAMGWDGQKTVWRAEFQLKGPTLRALGIKTWADALEKAESLWKYLTEKWVRYVEYRQSSSRTNRWSVAQFWALLRDFHGCTNAPPLKREKRIPEKMHERDYRGGLSSIIKHMAAHDIRDCRKGVVSFLKAAMSYHNRGDDSSEGFGLYVRERYYKRLHEFAQRKPLGFIAGHPDHLGGMLDDLESIPF